VKLDLLFTYCRDCLKENTRLQEPNQTDLLSAFGLYKTVFVLRFCANSLLIDNSVGMLAAASRIASSLCFTSSMTNLNLLVVLA
jgi:hypothetical protein